MTVDPTQVVTVQITDADGVEVVPAPGTVYRMSDPDGTYTTDLVLVAMRQADYNEKPPMRTRAADGYLLPLDDPRVKAALGPVQSIARAVDPQGADDGWDLRDVAEIVNAVLRADDELAATPPAPKDTRPHSRACGIAQHEHGTACHRNCPSCGGRDLRLTR